MHGIILLGNVRYRVGRCRCEHEVFPAITDEIDCQAAAIVGWGVMAA